MGLDLERAVYPFLPRSVLDEVFQNSLAALEHLFVAASPLHSTAPLRPGSARLQDPPDSSLCLHPLCGIDHYGVFLGLQALALP